MASPIPDGAQNPDGNANGDRGASADPRAAPWEVAGPPTTEAASCEASSNRRLRNWAAVIVAPDAPTRSWASDVSEQAVVALIEDVMARHSIDRNPCSGDRISAWVAGGTWFLRYPPCRPFSRVRSR